ncbi:DUF167 domain-containing protein [Candidatus Woesearchaeota archaeon]|nr:DUF167 domain-containing protein [Candidatus Woesearchaeota archaeon]
MSTTLDIKSHIHNNLLNIKVVPHSSQNKIKIESGQIKVYLQAPPEKDKANLALLKFLNKECGLKAVIKSGLHSREKVLEIIN